MAFTCRVAIVALVVVTGYAVAAPPSVVWEAVEQGAERGNAPGGDVPLELYRFDLKFFRLAVVLSKGTVPKPQRAEDVVRGVAGAVAAVNGGFFDERGRPLGLRIVDGDVAVPFRRKVDWGVLHVAGGRAQITHSRDFVAAPGIEAAVQVGPRILIDGVVPGLKPQVARRTAVALNKDGTSVTLVVAPIPIDATTLGTRLAAMGFHSALMLDGGPSTQLSVNLGGLPGGKHTPDTPVHKEIPGAYPVPDLLALVRRR
jgi:hypothetical protein